MDENGANAGDQFCEDITVTDCIISSNDESTLVGIDQHAADNGCTFQESIVWNDTDDVLTVGSTGYTVSEATVSGYFTNVTKENPNLP